MNEGRDCVRARLSSLWGEVVLSKIKTHKAMVGGEMLPALHEELEGGAPGILKV